MTKQKTIYGKIPVRKMPYQSVAAKNLVDQLLTDSIIERKEDYKSTPRYAPTMKGSALIMTRFISR